MSVFPGATNAQGDEQKRAELYMRIYKYAAEDFTSTKDFKIFENQLYLWMKSVEDRLSLLFKVVANHTHPLIPHVHETTPHVHISTAPGNPTSPNVLPLTTLPNRPYTVAQPNQSASLVWTKAIIPRFINTTGVLPNLTGNNVVMETKIGLAEDTAPHLRRGTIVPILLMPSVPEYITGLK